MHNSWIDINKLYLREQMHRCKLIYDMNVYDS